MADQSAKIAWRDDTVPVSIQFDDPYFSIANGLRETEHVFLNGNHLPERFKPGFHIAELGFGTGLNMLAAWQAWNRAGIAGDLRFTSFEAYPMAKNDIQLALDAFPEIADLAEPFLEQWSTDTRHINLPGLSGEIVVGDARQTLPDWDGSADAWFLDGFSPAKNPELWAPDLMQSVGDHTATQGSFATYTAAGHVRRALSDAGFSVERVPGFGHKRHMTIGNKAASVE